MVLVTGGRGNRHTHLDSGAAEHDGWLAGNLVRPLVHGATYFRRLYEELETVGAGEEKAEHA
ncbi:MAG: hypothetical protein H0U28_14345 [Nocardioidaceae bacterium]|nr:hypothetical protein [Nocardioidaceae bacterium]